MRLAMRLTKLQPEHRRLMGNKAAALARMQAAGFPVPATLVLAGAAFNRPEEALESPGPAAPVHTSATQMPEPASTARATLQRFLAEHPTALFAVRSSSTLEDMPHASHAGQFPTFLHVAANDVPNVAEQCLQGMAGADAGKSGGEAWTGEQRCAGEESVGAVLVQPMIAPVTAGVVMTNTAGGDGAVLLVEWSDGSENAVTGGYGKPNRLALQHRRLLGKRAWRRLRGKGRLPGAATGFRDFLRRCLKLEASFGTALDIEWAFDGRVFWFLQARPLTAPMPQAWAHDSATAPGVWTRRICEELWDEPMTPMTASIMVDRLAPCYTFPRALRLLGLGRLTRRAALRVFHNYLYLDCGLLAELRRSLYPLLESAEVQRLLPPTAPPPGGWRPAWVARACLGLLIVPILEPQALFLSASRRIQRRLAAAQPHAAAIPSRADVRQQRQHLERHVETIGRHQEISQWVYFHAMLATWALKAITARTGNEESFLSLIERLPEHATRRANRDLQQLFPLLEPLLDADPASSPMPGGRPATVSAALETYLQRYGSRAPHRDLCFPRWHEHPAVLWEALRSLTRLSRRAEHRTSCLPTPSFLAAQAVERQLVGHTRWPYRWLLVWAFRRILFSARRYLALREDLRAGLDQLLDALRQDLLRLAEEFVRDGMIHQAEDIFFLRLDETLAALSGDDTLNFAAAIEPRRRAFEAAQTRQPPLFLTTSSALVQAGNRRGADASPPAYARLFGIGVSKGRAVGVARVIHCWEHLASLGSGEVLVAPHIDPSWTPHVRHASAVVAEAGGLLSHGAIMARELGLPMVVGVRRATEALHSGDCIEVDGDDGSITLRPASRESQAAR